MRSRYFAGQAWQTEQAALTLRAWWQLTQLAIPVTEVVSDMASRPPTAP